MTLNAFGQIFANKRRHTGQRETQSLHIQNYQDATKDDKAKRKISNVLHLQTYLVTMDLIEVKIEETRELY